MKIACSLFLLCFVCNSFATDTLELTEPAYQPDGIYLQPTGEYAGFDLLVSGPDGIRFKMAFSGDETPLIDLLDNKGDVLPDGKYNFMLTASPALSEEMHKRLRHSRGTGETISDLPQGKTQSGVFTILDGQIVLPHEDEPPLFHASKDDSLDGETYEVPDSDEPGRDQVILDDLIVDGSACIGFDCVNGESFGFDTIRLKENNLRIKFEDTSAASSFPSRDWQITANASANGGGEYLAFTDVGTSRNVFLVEGNAPSNALYVDDGGRVGFGTSIPVVDLHVKSGNSPTLRLEQDGTSGFAPQTWDVAGNETNFFVRDATNGSTLPFRIRPGAPSSVIFIDTDGEMGINDTSPEAALDVNGTAQFQSTVDLESDGAQLNITDTTSTTGNRFLLNLSNNGNTKLSFNNTYAGSIWEYVVGNNGQFYLFEQGNADHAMDVFGNGNVTINGTLTENSDVNAKENITPIEPMAVLDGVLELPISTWNYKDTCADVVHMGPMAQDFHFQFGLNGRDDGISSLDTNGVALGAIQGLNAKFSEEAAAKDALIDSLQEQLAAQKAQIQSQEARLKALEAALLK